MDSPFNYSKYVTGKYNYGRKAVTEIFGNILFQGENVVVYEPPKTGKTSMIQQSFFQLKSSGRLFSVADFDMLSIRSIDDFVTGLGSAMLQAVYSSPAEFSQAVQELLPGTHFVFDERQYSDMGKALSLNWDVDDKDLAALFALPYKLGKARSQKLIVLMDEFQNVMQTEDGDKICRQLEACFRTLEPELKQYCSYVFSGSKVNAMHEIFGVKRYFYRNVERVRLSEIDTKEIIDNVSRGFLASGKVVDRDLMLGVCKLFRNHIWYINHFAAICDSLTRGYIMEPILNAALEAMLAIHESRFKAIVDDLTSYQVSMLRAILDGQTKFTASEVIERYGFNSSANVRRLKDALSKKEIAIFEDNGVTIIDPLFEYWARTFYFKMSI